MRLIPIAVDIIIISVVLSAVMRIGRLEIRAEKVSNMFVVRWILLQLVFIGDTVIDTLVKFALDSGYFVAPAKDDTAKGTLTGAALSGLASALGMGSASLGKVEPEKLKAAANASGRLTPDPDHMKKRSSSNMRGY